MFLLIDHIKSLKKCPKDISPKYAPCLRYWTPIGPHGSRAPKGAQGGPRGAPKRCMGVGVWSGPGNGFVGFIWVRVGGFAKKNGTSKLNFWTTKCTF